MKLLAFAVRDEAVQSYMPPFFTRHVGEALRSFADACLDEKHQFSKHAEDYVLYALGSFDDASGLFEPKEPYRLSSGNEVKAKFNGA